MRLLKEIPKIESKIESGALTLSNICQAQSFFRDVGHTTEDGRPKILAKDDKVKILGLLENKTARDATKELLADLVARLADVGVAALRVKKFGKQRIEPSEIGADGHVRRVTPTPTSELRQQSNPRYISRELKHLVWQRDKGACTSCGTRRGLNFDHIIPVAHGGESTAENLRLLCFHCNQRAGIRLWVIRVETRHLTTSN